MKRKVMSKIVAISMALCLVFTSGVFAFAEDGEASGNALIASGTCGENLTWELTESGTLTISGTGEMHNFNYEGLDNPAANLPAPWLDYQNNIKQLVVEEGVTSIGHHAFWHCKELTAMTLPDSIETIGDWAFYNCKKLTGELAIPKGVTYIGDRAFEDCSSLTSVVIPDGVTHIGYSAFSRCSGLTGKLILPDSLTYIGDSAFHFCKGLNGNLKIPSNLISIGDSVFSECYGFDGILELPEGLIQIGDYAFSNCSNLKGTLYIPQSVKKIGRNAFFGCSGFSGEFDYPEQVEEFGYGVFEWCSGLTGEIIIPETWTSIPANAFSGLSGFTGEIVIPDNITSIGDSAFYGCSGLTGELVIPDSVTSIGSRAFMNCKGLDGELRIPNSVEVVGEGAFSYCEGFTGTLTLSNSITQIEDFTFDGCTGLSGEVVIPDGVTHVGYMAFDNCRGVTSVILPDSIKEFEDYAFHCDSKVYQNIVYKGTKEEWEAVTKPDSIKTMLLHIDCSKVDCTDWIAEKRATTTADGKKSVTCKTCKSKVVSPIYKISQIRLTDAKWNYDDFKSNIYHYKYLTIKNSSGKSLKYNSDYTVTFKKANGTTVKKWKNIGVGKYKCIVTFIGDYKGSITRNVTIAPNATAISSVKAGNDSITVKWNKRTEQVTGYQVRYSTSSKFNSSTTKTITNNKTVSKTYKGLKDKKTYYVKVRTYKTVNGTKYYSDWSAVKSVKTK